MQRIWFILFLLFYVFHLFFCWLFLNDFPLYFKMLQWAKFFNTQLEYLIYWSISNRKSVASISIKFNMKFLYWTREIQSIFRFESKWYDDYCYWNKVSKENYARVTVAKAVATHHNVFFFPSSLEPKTTVSFNISQMLEWLFRNESSLELWDAHIHTYILYILLQQTEDVYKFKTIFPSFRFLSIRKMQENENFAPAVYGWCEISEMCYAVS